MLLELINYGADVNEEYEPFILNQLFSDLKARKFNLLAMDMPTSTHENNLLKDNNIEQIERALVSITFLTNEKKTENAEFDMLWLYLSAYNF